MPAATMIQTFVEYHVDMTRRVWDSAGQISEPQFLADDPYSRGSIRNLLVHMTHTDLRWLTGLKNLPDIGDQLQGYSAYPSRAVAHAYWETVGEDLLGYAKGLGEAELEQQPADIPMPRWQVLLHLVNHGTDHRSTVLQQLHIMGAPTFDQDFILWLAAGSVSHRHD